MTCISYTEQRQVLSLYTSPPWDFRAIKINNNDARLSLDLFAPQQLSPTDSIQGQENYELLIMRLRQVMKDYFVISQHFLKIFFYFIMNLFIKVNAFLIIQYLYSDLDRQNHRI